MHTKADASSGTMQSHTHEGMLWISVISAYQPGGVHSPVDGFAKSIELPQTMLSSPSLPHTMLSSPSLPQTMLSSPSLPQTMLSSPSLPHTMFSASSAL